jgi:hypothetical protein
MSMQANSYKSETVIPLSPERAGSEIDQLDRAGETILTLLHRAAGAAEQNSKQALEMAQTLSQQLRDAEQQIAGCTRSTPRLTIGSSAKARLATALLAHRSRRDGASSRSPKAGQSQGMQI